MSHDESLKDDGPGGDGYDAKYGEYKRSGMLPEKMAEKTDGMEEKIEDGTILKWADKMMDGKTDPRKDGKIEKDTGNGSDSSEYGDPSTWTQKACAPTDVMHYHELNDKVLHVRVGNEARPATPAEIKEIETLFAEKLKGTTARLIVTHHAVDVSIISNYHTV